MKQKIKKEQCFKRDSIVNSKNFNIAYVWYKAEKSGVLYNDQTHYSVTIFLR